MGKIIIEQYGSVGSDANRDAPVYDLNTLLANTVDATTSSTAESVVLDSSTRAVSVYAVEDHRVCIGSDTTATKYATVVGGTTRDFGVNAGDTLYYELDA